MTPSNLKLHELYFYLLDIALMSALCVGTAQKRHSNYYTVTEGSTTLTGNPTADPIS